MHPVIILGVAALYFTLLLGVAWWTGRRADASGYFQGNRKSPWYIVAFGMIGDSLSGVTYISVPGKVGVDGFSYLQVVFGYVLGYVVIAQVLLPLYYRLQVVSIYEYLGRRFGWEAQRTGAFFFILSRLLGAAARLYLAAQVFQVFVFDRLDTVRIPFELTTAVIIGLILLYTLKGGIKTLVWTDFLQSGFLVLGVLLSLWVIGRELGLGWTGWVTRVVESDLSRVFDGSWRSPGFFPKQFLSGAAIAIVMTGLDQNNMQKSLSCPNIRDAQKNIYSFTLVMVLVNVFFLSLGVLLHEFAQARGVAIPTQTDRLFPMLALQELGWFAGLVFVVGLTAATFNSADSVLTTLTTSFCYDFLRIQERTDWDERARERRRWWVHGGFAVVLFGVILGFKATSGTAVIDLVLGLAGYTYGPLLGLFLLGRITSFRMSGPWIPVVCCLAPLICYGLQARSEAWFNGYRFGFELLLVNAALTMAGLWLVARVAPDRRA